MKIVWIVLLVPLCHNGIPSAEGSQSQDSTSSTPDEKQLSMQISLMNGLAENFKKDFSFTSSHKVHQQMDKIFSKLNIYDAKAQMRLLENLGDLIILQNENIKSLVNFVGKLVSEMNIDKLDGQKSLLKNLQNMVASLSGDESVTSVKRLLEKTTTSYDELVQANLEKTTNLYLSSNSNELPNSETIEELSNMVTVHGSFNTNGNIVSVLLQLVKSENENDGSVRIESEDDNRLKINEALQNAQTLYNEMAKDKLNEIKIRSSNKQQQSTLKDLDSMILRMENLEQPNQISLLETLFNLAQEENSSLNVYNRKFKQMNTLYNKSVKEKLEHIEERYFTSEVEYMKYTPPDDRILEQIESLISKINEPDVNDRILVILHRLNDLTPSDEILRDELIGKLETLNNEVAIVQLEAISKQCTENSENIDDSVFQKLDRMIADTRYFDETTKRSLVEVLYQLAYAGKENVKRSKQLIKKATTFIDQWIADHLNRILEKYNNKQTDIPPDDEIFHQLDIMMSPYNQLLTSYGIVKLLEVMTNLASKARLERDKLLRKAKNYYNASANEKLDDLLEKLSKKLPHAISSNDDIFDELDSLISEVNHIHLNERIMALLDKIETYCEDAEAEAKHDKLVEKMETTIYQWAAKEMNKIEESFREHKQSVLLLPEDPIFHQLDSVITDTIWPDFSMRVKKMILNMKPLCVSDESKHKLTVLLGKNTLCLSLAAKRNIRRLRRKFQKQLNILPEDLAVQRLTDMIESMENFMPDVIEQIFLTLRGLTSTNAELMKKRAELIKKANSKCKSYVEDRLTLFRRMYGNKEFLEKIAELIFETNDLETNVIILKHLLEMKCEEEEDGETQEALIRRVKDLEDQWVQNKFEFMVHNYLDSVSEQTSTEDAETNEVDKIISNLKYMLPKTQECIIRDLLQFMNTKQSNLDGFIKKWYDNCTIPELREKYKELIELQSRDSASPLGVENTSSQTIDSRHQASNNDLHDDKGLQEEHNLNYSHPMASDQFSPTEVGTPRETSRSNLEPSAQSNPSLQNPSNEQKD